jgi:Zn-dependent peptidase ImmA (M78 family)/transcriptional regulator with XRE-family HTH domain
MTVGVTGFVGERLTEAREARGIMSKSALADLLDVSSNAISQYENNTCKPRYEVLSQIADLLKVKESFFFRPLLPAPENPIFWRSRHAATKASRVVAKRKFNWAKSIADEYLKSYLDFPELAVPSRNELSVPDDPKTLSDNQIEEIASRCRSYWGLGKSPISNLTVLLEDHGLLITYGSLESPKLDAFSSVSEIDHSFHMFLSTDSRSAPRSRFDCAHELGHLILHSHLSTDYFEPGKKTERHALIEHQAYRFASSFLMPADSFRGDVWMTALEPLLSLKEEWKVSVAAMIKRCDDLGMLDESHARRLWINYNRQWKDGEPDDEKVPFEQAEIMKRCFDTLIESRVKTKGAIVHDLPYSQRDIETLMNLPEGYLNEDFGELRRLPTVKADLRVVGGQDSATVFDFESKKPR